MCPWLENGFVKLAAAFPLIVLMDGVQIKKKVIRSEGSGAPSFYEGNKVLCVHVNGIRRSSWVGGDSPIVDGR